MADSDDDYEFGGGGGGGRRRHNKFRNERDDLNEYGNGGGGGGAVVSSADASGQQRFGGGGGGGGSTLSSMVVTPAVYKPSRPYESSSYKNERRNNFQRGGSSQSRYGGGGGGGARYDYYGGGGGGDRYGSDYVDRSPIIPGFNKRSYNGMSHAPYYGGGDMMQQVDSAPPGDYDDFPPQKKTRRDWSSVLDEPPISSGYFEHDTRSAAAPEYDDYLDEYSDDYNRLNRPANYSSSYKPPYDPLDKSAAASGGGYYRQPYLHQQQQVGGRFQQQQQGNSYYGNNNFNRQPYGQSPADPYPGGGQVGYGYGGQQQQQRFGNSGNTFRTNPGMMGANTFNSQVSQEVDSDGHPQMMSFKQFLGTLNSDPSNRETVTADLATQKYTEYKNNYRREQIIKFFAAHKTEDWFKYRYHPKMSSKRKEEQRESIKRRLDLFVTLLDRYGSDPQRPLSLDMTDERNCTWLYKFLDAAMVRLEGGAEPDLELVEQLYSTLQREEEEAEMDAKNGLDHHPEVDAAVKGNTLSDKESGVGSDDETTTTVKPEAEKAPAADQEETTEVRAEVVEGGAGQLDIVETIVEQEKDAVKEELETMLRTETPETTASAASKAKVADLVNRFANINKLQQHLQKLNAISAKIPQKTQSIFFKHLPVIVNRQDLEEIGKKYEGFKRASISEPAPERRFQRRGWITFDSSIDIRDTCAKVNGTRLYDMQLHVTVNRELDHKIKCVTGLINHKNIIRHDLKLIAKVVENMDKRWGLWSHGAVYDAALQEKCADKQPVHQEMDTNCADAADEIKATEEGETSVVEMKAEDKEAPVEEAAAEAEPVDAEFVNKYNELYHGRSNPLLSAALDYLRALDEAEVKAKEAAAAAEEAKKEPETETETTATVVIKPIVLSTPPVMLTMEKDAEGARHLDRLILYLRLVHSIDFYNVTEYPQEDYMPNRCGALHVRGSTETPANSNSGLIVSVVNSANVNQYDVKAIRKSQLDEWMRLFEMNIRSYADYHERIDDDLAKKLGLKDLKAETDTFMAANCQKVDKDIWLCPLSGKKFKGPDYVRKHIESKHADKLAELALDVDYFNRFVLDPKRPYLPEHPILRHNNNNQQQQNWNNGGYNQYNNGGYNQQPDYRMNQAGYRGYSYQNAGAGGYHDYAGYSNTYNNNSYQQSGFNPNYNNRFNNNNNNPSNGGRFQRRY